MTTRSRWQQLPTEAINPASLDIDKLPLGEIIELMILDNRWVLGAIQEQKNQIARGAEMVTQALDKGGRLILVGAGTSGRLGVLEAAEIPPTFGTSPDRVQAIMAGGKAAVHRAKEGVEDDHRAGARAMRQLRPRRPDAVIGITASGMTPFVRGALEHARKAGAAIIGLTCDPHSALQTYVDHLISLPTGPEVIAGSTRLKAGTATKVVLNMLTTAAMVRLGKTYGNLMVDVTAGSEKLRDRARRIIGTVTGLDYGEADRLLRRAKGNVKTAIVMQKTGLTPAKARARLRQAHESVREVMGEV